MDLHTIDLNLFVVFRAIYQEAHITRAAKVLGLTQPAVSHSLSRLRELYQDQIFVRRGPRMEPTPLARSLLPKIMEALEHLHHSLPQGTPVFDPSVTQQNFILATRDPLEAFFLPQLLSIFTEKAPRAQVTSLRIRRQDLQKELQTGQVDLALDVLLPISSALRSQRVAMDHWVVVGRPGHPLLQKDLSLESYLSARHIVVSSRRAGLSMEDFEFHRRGWQRTVGLRCQHLYAAVCTVACTDLLLTLPALFLESLGPGHELDRAPLPFTIPMPAIYMYWHERQDSDQASLWLRSQLGSLAVLHD